MTEDQVQRTNLKPTEQDVREMCEVTGVPFAGMVALWRRFNSIDDKIETHDVLYVMALAKSKGLNPLDNNYALIPRADGKGFSLTFTKDAALAVITNHPRVKPGSLKRWFVTGEGKDILWSKSPSLKSLAEIDWLLEAHCSVEDEDGNTLEGVARYRNSCSTSPKDGNPKFLWMKDAGGMLMKQAYKDLANTQFGGALPDDDDALAAIEAERIIPAGLLAAPPPTPVSAEKPQAPAVDPVAAERIVQKAETIGTSREMTLAVLQAQLAKGVSLEAFERGLDRDVETAERRKPAAKVKIAKPAEEKPKKEELPVKPLITVQGTVDAVAERRKTLADGKLRKFMVLSLGGDDYYLWDSKLFEAAHLAWDGTPQPTTRIGYVISESKRDPGKGFYEIRELELLPPTPAPPEIEAEAPPESVAEPPSLFNF